MNENYKKIRVSPKIAELLKELGFDRTCEFYFTNDKFSHHNPDEIILMRGERETNWNADEFTMFVRNNQVKVHNGTYYDYFREKDITRLFISAPTLDEAQRWIREIKKIAIYVCPSFEPIAGEEDEKWEMKWQVSALPCDFDADDIILGNIEEKCYDTYEKALEAGIEKVAELLKDEPIS